VTRALPLVLLLACSGSDGSAPTAPHVGSGAGTCADRTGSTYLATVHEHPGSFCGLEGKQFVVQAPSTHPPPAGDAGPQCTGSADATPDNCEVTYNTTCPSQGVQGAAIKEEGHSKWSVDGSYATAIETLILFNADGSTACTSTVDLTLHRQ